MKLQELESKTKAQQSRKVFETYFGQKLAIDNLSVHQVQQMLEKTRRLIKEHRARAEFHRSEQNPSYLKLVFMEQALTARMAESSPGAAPGMAMAPGNNAVASTATSKPPAAGSVSPADAGKSALSGVRRVASVTGQGDKAALLNKALDTAAQGKPLNPMQRQELGKQLGGLQKALTNPQMATRLQQMLKTATAESRDKRRLKEASELQQAQVVLAAQDMVDQIQGMIEDISAMQFKDLPALVNSIRNDIGMDQAQQYNNDVTSALQGLIQGLQGTKTQLESSQGILTGQAPVVPGTDQMGAAPVTGEVDVDADIQADLELPPEETEEEPPRGGLGRERR